MKKACHPCCYSIPKISILSSVYNESLHYIREFIESILNQSFSEYELIIIIDNPKRKELLDIINSYNDDRIIVHLNTENLGLALSMNKAANMAKSEVLARMDADDIAYPNRLEREYKLICSKKYDFIFTGYDLIDEQSSLIRKYKPIPPYSQSALIRQIHLKHIIHHPTVMFTKEVFYKVGGYRNFPCTQDLDLWFRMVENGCRFFMINEPLLKYRINSNSVSVKKWFLQKLTGNYIFKLSIERLQKGYDSYSLDNYHKYLNDNGIDNKVEQYMLRRSQSFLYRASNSSSNCLSLLYRVIAFLISSISREHYFMLNKKKKLIS